MTTLKLTDFILRSSKTLDLDLEVTSNTNQMCYNCVYMLKPIITIENMIRNILSNNIN